MIGRRALVAGLAGAALAAPSRAAPARSRLVAFDTSPFPYDGPVPGKDKMFLDAEENGRRGHKLPTGFVYWEDQTYSDRRVLLHVAPGFDARRRAAIVVFFHGNGATLQADVIARQGVPRQFDAARPNALLVAPQFAVNARDSSAGNFWRPGFFATFLEEAAAKLAPMTAASPTRLAGLPLVLVAYSGGYHAMAYALSVGGVSERVSGVILLDALYGEVEVYADWFQTARARAFLVAAFGPTTKAPTEQLRALLAGRGIQAGTGLPPRIGPGTFAIQDSGTVVHKDFMTRAWVPDPLRVVLARLR